MSSDIIEILNYIVDNALILIPVLYIIRTFLEPVNKLRNILYDVGIY